MVRQALRYQVLDSSGVPIAGASIQVAQLGTTTNITQTMYAGLTGVTTTANPLITDASGRVQAYFDGTDAVALLRVTMIPTLTGFTFTSRDVQLGSDYGVLDAGDVPIKGLTVDAKDRFNMARTDAGDPATLVVGDMWYNTATNALHWEDNTGTQTVSSTTGDITGVTAGDGLTGGGLTGDVTLDVGDGNAIVASADAVDVSVNAATSAAAALAGDDKILISDTDDSNTTKSATISQIDPTMLDGTANQVYFSNSTGNVTGLTLGAAGTILTSAGATSDPTFGTAATVGANKTMYTNNSDVESGLAFGAAGTVLTSGGTDATATPPTWETPAGGSEITLNSSAAIALGKFVVLETAGTVKEVSASTSIVLAFGTKSTATIGTALLWGQQEPSVTWDPTRNVFWCTCMAQASNNIVVYIMEISSAGVVSIAHVTTYSASGIGTYGQQASSVDTTNDKLVMYWRYSNGYMYGVAAPLSGTGGTSTVGAWSAAVLQSYGQYSWTGVPVKTLYVAATDRTYCFFTNQSQYAMFGVLDTSAATPVWTSTGSWVDGGVFNNQYYGWDAALAANGNICLVGGANGSWAGMTAYSITPLASGGTYQGYAQVQSGGIGSTQGVAVVYDASEGKMVGYGVGNHYKYYVSTWVIPATGAPNTVSTVLDVEAGLTSAFAYTSRIRPPLGYDDVNGVVVIGYRLTSTSMIQFDQVVTSATNPTMFGSAIASTMSYANWPNFGLGQGYTGSWIGFAGLWGTDPGGYPVAAASVSTNNTKQIGIAQNAVAGAAAAVTIKTLGALDETQTGMTVGDIYIDQNGAPSSSIGSYGTLVGRAIASDKLLITVSGSGTV